MEVDGFFVAVHMDRFHDLSLVIGDHPVTVMPWMMNDSRVLVRITGGEEILSKLEFVLHGIKHILYSAPVLEESE